MSSALHARAPAPRRGRGGRAGRRSSWPRSARSARRCARSCATVAKMSRRAERDVMHAAARRPVALTCARGARALAQRHVQHDAHAALRIGQAAACGSGRRGRRARGSRRAPGPSTARQNRIQVSNWSGASRARCGRSLEPQPASARRRAARLGDEVDLSSRAAADRRHEVDHACRPGATIAGSSQLVRRRAGCRGAPTAAHRAARGAQPGRPSPRPIAQTDGPCSSKRARASEPGSRVDDELDRRPAGTASTCLACDAARRARSRAARAARRAPARRHRRRANSMKAKPVERGAAGGSNSAMRSSARAAARGRRLAAPSHAPARAARAPRLSRKSSERIASTAVRRFGVSRNMVVEDLERERAGIAGAAAPARRSSSRSNWPWPGKLRWCRAHCSTSIASSGASAICRKKIRSPGIAAMPRGSSLQRQRVEAVEDQAEVRMVGALHDRPRPGAYRLT